MRTKALIILTLFFLALGFQNVNRVVKAQTATITNLGPGGGTVQVFTVDPNTPSVLYAAVFGGRLYKSTNGGASWNLVFTFSAGISGLAVDPANSSNVYSTTNKLNK